MEFFRLKKDIPFMSYGKVTTMISLLTFILAVFFLITKPLHLSVDFTGGTVLEVNYTQSANLEKIRDRLATLKLGEVVVQNFGTSHDVLIRVPTIKNVSSAQLSERIVGALRLDAADMQLRRVEFVGPSVGDELVSNGLLAIAMVCVGIVLYLSVRFEWRFAVSAIIANMHDVVIILGCFAYFQWEFSLTVLAGILAVLGYSVNESVVVFDRIRENFLQRRFKDSSVHEVIDNAITATMSRTIITHGCTQMMVFSMLMFGGETLHGFAMALTIGILFGIYSSVLVASPIALWLGVSREHFMKPVDDGEQEEAVV